MEKGEEVKMMIRFFSGRGRRKEEARTDGICEAQSAGGLDAASDVLDRGARVADEAGAVIDVREEAGGEHLEARDDALARERCDVVHGRRLGYLHLQRALSKAERERLGHEGVHLGLEDHVLTRDAEIDVAFSDEGGYVGCGEEDAGVVDVIICHGRGLFVFGLAVVGGGGGTRRGKWNVQHDRVVLHEADVQSIRTVELDVRT